MFVFVSVPAQSIAMAVEATDVLTVLEENVIDVVVKVGPAEASQAVPMVDERALL